MTRVQAIFAFAAMGFSLAGCGGSGEPAKNEAADLLPGQSVNASDGINTSADASGTTGSTTGDAGGPLNIAGDAEGDSKEANMGASNAQ